MEHNDHTTLLCILYFIIIFFPLEYLPTANALSLSDFVELFFSFRRPPPEYDSLSWFMIALVTAIGFTIGAGFCVDLSPQIPNSWLIGSALIGLFEVLFLSKIIYLFTSVQIGWWLLPTYLFTLTLPFIGYSTIFLHKKRGNISDADILTIAKKYGGILTPSVIVWEEKVSLEEAKKSLERFRKHGEANKRNIGCLVIYDFPGARAYLSRADNQIIEVLRDNPYGMSRAHLLQATNFSIESLDEALKRLESKGIIHYDMEDEIYKLTGIAPTTKNIGAAK